MCFSSGRLPSGWPLSFSSPRHTVSLLLSCPLPCPVPPSRSCVSHLKSHLISSHLPCVSADPILLRNKARALRKQTGDSRWTAPSERVKKSMARAIGRSLLRPFQLLLFEPMCLNLCLFSAILLGILYLFFGAFPLVFGNNHGFNVWQTGLAFLGIMVSMLLGVATDPLWHRIRARLIRKYERETGVSGASEPEFRLPPAILGSLLAPAGLFMFGWSTYPWVHWIVPIIGSAIFGMG